MSRYIGEEQINVACRRLFERHSTATLPLPTALDLYRELQAVTP
jgi:ABC-2 type transport system permease protein